LEAESLFLLHFLANEAGSGLQASSSMEADSFELVKIQVRLKEQPSSSAELSLQRLSFVRFIHFGTLRVIANYLGPRPVGHCDSVETADSHLILIYV